MAHFPRAKRTGAPTWGPQGSVENLASSVLAREHPTQRHGGEQDSVTDVVVFTCKEYHKAEILQYLYQNESFTKFLKHNKETVEIVAA